MVLRVRDTGVGIPQANQDRVFTPFFTTHVEAGRGLGLATSRRIVEDHKGHLLLQSSVGEGTTVTVTLPREQASPDLMKPSAEPFDGHPLTILAIDDMEGTVTMLHDGLKRYNHTVLTAMSGSEGLDILTKNRIDLVICDLGMPEMNGWEVGKRIKATCEELGIPGIPFIILTGWADLVVEEETLAACGVDAVLEKPVDVPALLQTISEVMHNGGSI